MKNIEKEALDYSVKVEKQMGDYVYQAFIDGGEFAKIELYQREKQIDALVQALEHIASPKHWPLETFVPEIRDRVHIARQALRVFNG